MGPEQPSSTCKNVVTFATRQANFDCWELEWTQCWSHMKWVMDIYGWQVAQGRIFVHQYSGKLFLNAEFCAMKPILVFDLNGWRTFVTNREEIHNNVSKLNCRSHIPENCIVAFESGPSMEEPCPAEMADYGHVYYDIVTGASLPSKLCEEAMQLEMKVHEEGDECVHTLRARSRERARTHSDWDTWGLYEQGRYRTSFHPSKIGCSRDKENDEDGFDGHFYDTCCDPTC